MSGTWTDQNKILPGAYINIRTNEPLSITLSDRGIVVILQEISVGANKTIYTMTGTESDLPDKVTTADKKLAVEALKNAKKVLVYTLPPNHTQADVEEALESLKTVKWDILCYPYDGESEETIKAVIAAFIQTMRENEGIKCQAVLANHAGDYEGIINVTQGVVMSDGTEMTAAEVTAWVSGATAGASITSSNTGKIYTGAIDVIPRMTKTEMEKAVKEGQLIFKADNAQNVSVVYDINSLITHTEEKGKLFSKNRVVRTLDSIANDLTSIFESNYVGKVSNNTEGRSLLKAMVVDYFNTLLTMGAIQNFETDDVNITAGRESDAVVVDAAIQPVDCVEKIYITVKLS